MPESTSVQMQAQKTSKTLNRIGKAARSGSVMILWIGLSLAGAGRLDWWRGWTCAIVYIVAVSITGALVKHFNRGLMEARERWRSNETQWFDKVWLSIFMPLTFGQWLVAGLDAVRFQWLRLPLWTMVPGILLFFAAIALVTWAMLVNPFAEATVRLQSDRGQKVVSSGPYGIVRHPMYLGMILMYPATALMLGSGWAMVVAGLLTILIVWRTAHEDEFLHRELPGYREFAGQTRFRLIPGIW